MEEAKDVLEVMFSRLDKFLKTETVIGDPIVIDDIKLVPIVTASFGLGGGFGGENKDKSNTEGGGGGLGCRISPDAILITNKGQVELVKLEGRGSLDKLFQMMPEILDKAEGVAKAKFGHKKEKSETENNE
ncbi:MAG: GerW family sporulation protein [Bacillota bacterium]